MEHARALWEELDLYPLNVQSPWHGYGLGDWTDRWETFARRAATGDWELTGSETLARRADLGSGLELLDLDWRPLTDVARSAVVRRAILDKDVRVLEGAQVGVDHDRDRERGFTVSAGGVVVVGKGEVVEP